MTLACRLRATSSAPLPLLFGVAATDDTRAAVRAATGVSVDVFDAMHLSVYRPWDQ